MSEIPAEEPREDPADRRTALALVAAQMVLIAAVVLVPVGRDWAGVGRIAWAVPGWLRAVGLAGTAVGLVVMLVGGTALGRGLTALPLPNEHATLRTGGLYRWVRHPIYSGLLLAALASAVATGGGLRLVAALALTALIAVKARWEEVRLARRFPGYGAYASRTPRFVPGLRRRGRAAQV